MSATLHPSSSRFAASWLALGLWLVAGCSSPSASVDAALDLGADQVVPDAQADARGLDALADTDESTCVRRREPLPPVPRDAPILARRGLAWRSAVGATHGVTYSPALLGDRIILPINQTGVVAVDLQGKLLWTEQVFGETAWQFDTEVYPHTDGTVAYTTPDGTLIMLDSQGQRLWSQTGLGPFVDFGVPNILATLRLDDGSTVVTTSGQRLIRVSAAGTILWSRHLPVEKPVPAAHLLRLRGPRDRLIVAGSEILAYDTEGTLLWHRPPPIDANDQIVSGLASLSSGDLVIYWSFRDAGADWTDHLYRLEPSCGRMREIVTLPWGAFPLLLVDDRDSIFVMSSRPPARTGVTRYRPDGQVAWDLEVGDPYALRSMVLGSDGALFVMENVYWQTGSRVLRVDVETGASTVVFAQADFQFTGHPLIVDGLLISGAFDPFDPVAKSVIFGLRVSSPRLMQRSWPRLGGGNDNAFTFK